MSVSDPASPDGGTSALPRIEGLRGLAVFVAIGGGAAAGFIALCWVLMGALPGTPRWMVSTACYGLFVLPVYWAHHRFSFRSAAPHAVALPRYVATQGLAVAVSAIIAVPVYHLFHLDPLPGSVLVTGLTSLGSFVVLKLWAFRG